MKTKSFLVIICLVGAAVLTRPAAAATFDHSGFDRVLRKYVDDKGLVDYNSIARDKTFKDYIKSLQTSSPETLSRDGQLAFWINAYNAITIAKVIKWKPKKSVRETLIPGLWISTKFYSSRENRVAGRDRDK